jgi:hypothetical protein
VGLSCNHCCSGKAISITYSERVSLALVHNEHTPYYNVTCGLSSSTIFLHNISEKARFLGRGGITEHKTSFNFLYNFFSETFLILRRIQQDIIINVHRSSYKVPVTLVRF